MLPPKKHSPDFITWIYIIVDMLSYVAVSDENPGPPRCDDVIRPANNSTFYFCWMGPNDSKLLISISLSLSRGFSSQLLFFLSCDFFFLWGGWVLITLICHLYVISLQKYNFKISLFSYPFYMLIWLFYYCFCWDFLIVGKLQPLISTFTDRWPTY